MNRKTRFSANDLDAKCEIFCVVQYQTATATDGQAERIIVKRWNFRTLPEAASVAARPEATWAEELGISPLLLDLLWKRGLDSKTEMDAFLSPNLRLLAPPDRWPGLPEAAEVLRDALRAGKSLAVWGDYDVDGITSTALVLDVLQQHGIEARPYLPDRRSEGYGLNIPALERLAAEGVAALLTVDCGISDAEAVARARELGMTVVISDHHLPPPTLPSAHAICNPRLGDCPCPQLAGVGVAFFLMAAVNSGLAPYTGRRCDMRDVLDLVALGTLADVVRLSGQNRILVKNGLLKIAQASRPGIASLKVVSGFNAAASLGGGQVVFSLAPRVNAAGRLGEAGLALRLLRAATHEEAAPLAQELDLMNTRRRSEEERIHKEARVLAAAQEHRAGLVLHGNDWHPGVIGIVASRIVDEFYRPTLILCDDNGSIKGSGRSVQEFDLHAGLSAISDVFLGFGGHR
ncbi:MAG: DHH family phosphoesterase, partial [Desulfovibrionaceae bacterium]|nr:DHH family phosphoesterase [Desulfovibrionaceae bacterium]